MKKEIEVLLVARPDHSLQIYNSLLEQNNFSFMYLSYKIFPKWVKKVFRLKKMTTVSKSAICSWRLTFINICRYKFKFAFAKDWDETKVFDIHLRNIFRNKNVKIIHYWPEYGDTEILKYISSNRNVKAYADIHMAHPQAVYESMKPIYQYYGINPETTQLYKMTKEQNHFAENATNLLVPSSYVADTYRKIYSDKYYYIVSYGISISPYYEKRVRNCVKEFVYAGRISLEKGSDLLLDFFSNHPEFNIHLYGGILNGQEFIFNKYKKFSNIFFHGSVPKIDLQKYLKRYDVGIHLSRFDAYSLAVGEMIGVGLPVIVSSSTGNKDDVKKYGFGNVTDLDIESIQKSINTISNIEYYNQCIDNIDSYVKSKPLNYGQKMIAFYKEQIEY